MQSFSRKVASVALSFVLAMVPVLNMSACSSNSNDKVVMEIGSSKLYASTLTSYIDSVKSDLGADTDAALESYVSDTLGTDMQHYWDSLLKFYGKQMAATEKFKELGITASDDDIEEARNAYKQIYGVSDEDFDEAVEQNLGKTPDEMDEYLAYNVKLKKLYEKEVSKEEPTTEEIQEYANTYRSSYHAVRCSVIYEPSGNLAQMQSVLKQLQTDPNADFATLAQQYTTGSANVDLFGNQAKTDGDSGWMVYNNVSSSFVSILDEMEVGELNSDVKVIDDMLYVIKKTGEYIPEEDAETDVDLNAMPSEIYDQLVEDVTEYNYQQTCSEYLESLYDDAEKVININSYYDL